MYDVISKPNEKIYIGKVGENEARRIIFPKFEDVDNAEDGTYTLVHQRSRDFAAYPCNITEDNSNIYWIVSSGDVMYPGYGMCEITYSIGDTIIKSETYKTYTKESLNISASPPEPWQWWVDSILSRISSIEDMLNPDDADTPDEDAEEPVAEDSAD